MHDSNVVSHVEVTLATAPHGDVVFGVPMGCRAMGLNVALMYGFGLELSLNDDIRFLEPLLQFTQLKHEMVGYIGWLSRVLVTPQASSRFQGVREGSQFLVKNRGVVFHGIQDVQHRREHLIIYVD